MLEAAFCPSRVLSERDLMNYFFRVIGACIIASFFAACSGATSPIATLTQQGATSATRLAPAASGVRPDERIGGAGYGVGGCEKIVTYDFYTNTWYVSYEPPGCTYYYPFPFDDGAGHVDAGPEKAWFVGQITSASSSQILEYNKSWVLTATLTGLTGAPTGIAIDAKDDVWATNSPSNTISEYSRGSTKPTATYTDASMSSISYLALDKSGDVYVSGQGKSGNLEVDELHGSSFAPIKTITGSVGGGITADANGKTLWVCDEGTGAKGTISSYTIPGFKRREQFAYSGSDTGIAVSASGKLIFAVNNTVASGSTFNVDVVIYSEKGKMISSSPADNRPEESQGIALIK
jgi:hypothetical protein